MNIIIADSEENVVDLTKAGAQVVLNATKKFCAEHKDSPVYKEYKGLEKCLKSLIAEIKDDKVRAMKLFPLVVAHAKIQEKMEQLPEEEQKDKALCAMYVILYTLIEKIYRECITKATELGY